MLDEQTEMELEQADAGDCEHQWQRLEGVTGRGVKLVECALCGAQEQEDYDK